MSSGVTIRKQVHFGRSARREKRLKAGPAPIRTQAPARIPRISRLMGLAIHIEQLVSEGTIADYAEAARLSHVTRARMTQILNLLMLAPDIQEELLFLPRVEQGRDPIVERDLRPIAAIPDWRKQRRMWREFERQAAHVNPSQMTNQATKDAV